MLALGAAVAAPMLARADDSAMPMIGFLNGATSGAFAARVAAFRRGLSEVGYVEDQNIAIEYRWAEGHYDRIPALAADLVARRVAVIVATGGGVVARSAKQATTSIPIVFTTGDDPVKTGLVASLNRPGGNATGVSLLTADLTAKRLELLRELVPAAKAVALFVNPSAAVSEAYTRAALAAAQGMGLRIGILHASTQSEIDLAFTNLAQQHSDALLVAGDPFLESERDRLVALAARYAVPSIFDTRDYADAGGLASYGPDYSVAYHEVGVYAGRILRGAKPADLPVVQLSKIELVINAKTAAALGVTVSPALLARADEVIE